MADSGSAVADFGWRPVADLEGNVAEIGEKSFILRARPNDPIKGSVTGEGIGGDVGNIRAKRPKEANFFAPAALFQVLWQIWIRICCGRFSAAEKKKL